MTTNDNYKPPEVWKWDAENGGHFASINRPIAGATHFKDVGLLTELPALKTLDLRGTDIHDIAQLPNLPALETLRLGRSGQPVSLQGIERFSKLTLLDITASEVGGLEGISTLVQLETMRIFDANLSDVQPIEQKTSLKTLCLGNCHLSELNVSGFTQLQTLTKDNMASYMGSGACWTVESLASN